MIKSPKIVPKKIIYELPLNERIRTVLRLEFLFQQVLYSIRGVSIWDSRNAISSLLEIVNIISRLDLRSELSKELQRQKKSMEALSNIPDINIEILQQTIASLNNCLYDLNTAVNKSDQEAPNEFLKTIQKRDTIPGGTCAFDIPVYHFWLNRPAEERIKTLETWLSKFEHYYNSINLILKNLRDSTIFKSFQASNGFYQQSLDSKSPYQLIRVSLPEEVTYFAELSGGKHRFSIRFMTPDITTKPSPCLENTAFELACCIF
ncbi:MAG: cell division protein ZapD [Pseudomonadota bacterium]